MTPEIRHDQEARRFVIEIDGRESFLSYVPLDAKTLDYRHTFVPDALRGRGVASRLVKHALDYAKDQQMKVLPTCPFVARIMERDAAYADLGAS